DRDAYRIVVYTDNPGSLSDLLVYSEALSGGRPRRVDVATIPAVIRQQVVAKDFRALAAAQQDRPSFEDVLPTMTMPCALDMGDADPLYPNVRQCAKAISDATFFALPSLDHAVAFWESRFPLPHVSSCLEAVGRRAVQRVPRYSNRVLPRQR